MWKSQSSNEISAWANLLLLDWDFNWNLATPVSYLFIKISHRWCQSLGVSLVYLVFMIHQGMAGAPLLPWLWSIFFRSWELEAPMTCWNSECGCKSKNQDTKPLKSLFSLKQRYKIPVPLLRKNSSSPVKIFFQFLTVFPRFVTFSE